MNKRTVGEAHDRIDGLEKEVVAIRTEITIQFKNLFGRVKRLEHILVGTSAAIIGLLVKLVMSN